jgi:pyruvate/2-oxoglutarate dehydrogenase complex dihydrolipoamide dehydrogenase (E3) component
VAGIGRKSDFSGLHLEAAGVAIDQSGALVVDEYLRTTNKNILAIGDAAGGPRFSHAAELQATILISNLFSPFKKKIRYHDFSRVTFTDPEVATFGHSEEALVKRGKGYQKLVLDFDEDDRAIAADYSYGKMILYITDNRNLFPNAKLLGGSLIAPAAGEMVQELILAKSAGLGIKCLFNKTYPYPTASRVNKSVVMNHYISTVRPWMKKILKILYASI